MTHCGANDTDRKAFAVSPSTRRQLSKEGPTNIVSLGPQEQDLEKKFANIVSLGPQEQEDLEKKLGVIKDMRDALEKKLGVIRDMRDLPTSCR